MPSEALFDHPEEARFYDWYLKDPKGKPFITFKFHYRSWENLASLQLIPEGHPQTILLPSPSLLSVIGLPRELQVNEGEFDFESESGSIIMSSEPSAASTTPWMTSVFDDLPASAAEHDNRKETSPAAIDSYSLRCPIPISKFSVSAEPDSFLSYILPEGNSAPFVPPGVLIDSPSCFLLQGLISAGISYIADFLLF